MKHVTQRQLRAFEAVARNRSFSRAAEEMHLTQPAVSTLIKQLEAHAGLALFEQLGKKIYLTTAGTEMLRHARAIIAQLREAEDAMAQLKGISGGTLNIAVISAGDYFFPRLLAEFQRRNAGVTLNLAVFNRAELLHQLASNLTDLAVMVRPPEELDTINESFAPHPYVVVASPDHALAGRRRIPISILAQEPFVMRERGSDTWNSMREAFGTQFGKLRIAMEIQSTETIKQAVIAGLGIAFLSAHTISMERRLGQLVVLDVVGFPARFDWFVVHRRNKRLPAVAQAFKSFLLSDGAGLIEHLMRAPDAAGATRGLARPRPRRPMTDA
ncbi:RuBisCO operon transcriptional regulator [Burkholderiales bacterium]|jgi:DNA-binding transcriptional LysR family regulator|nr:RuBisCO operon transcriptional regulator [Burkholderiales bacterium]